MNRRNVLVGSVVLLVVLIAINLWPKPPPPSQKVAVAVRDIEPFTVIEEGMVVITDTIDIEETLDVYYDAEDVACKMARQPIKAKQIIHRSAVLDYCFGKQPEIISLPARFSEMVGGQLKPLHRINIWGYRGGRSDQASERILIASGVLVVDVRTARGGDAALPMPTPGEGGGFLGGMGGEQAEPASIVTVAADDPDVVQQIIDYLGAQGFQAWVTLTGEQVWTPAPADIPTPAMTMPTPTPSTPTRKPMSDLVVLSITTDPSPMVEDWPGTVRVEVKNQGLDEIATACWVGLYIHRPAKADPDQQMFCPPLSVDESAVISYTVTLAEVGYHALTAWVDWLEAIPEEDEANNQYSASIFVEPPPTATPTPTTTPIPMATPTPTHTPTLTATPTRPTGTVGPVIDLSLENTPYQWQLDVVFDDGVNPVFAVSAAEIRAAGVVYRRDFYTRELTLTVTNMYPPREDVWIIRTDQNKRAEVLIDGHSTDEEGRDMFEWGKEGTVVIRLIGGATEATVTLLDSVAEAEGAGSALTWWGRPIANR